MALQWSKKIVAVATAVAVLAAAAGGVWWARHRAPQAGPQGDALLSETAGPFAATACQTRMFEDQPALAVVFSEPVARSQSFDKLITVVDQGRMDGKQEKGEEQAQKSGPTAASSAVPVNAKIISGSWVVTDNPRVIVFPYIQPQRKYQIKVGAGLEAHRGEKLSQGKDCEVATEDMPPSYFFASKGTVLPAKQNGGLPIVTVNVPEVDIQFLRVETAQLPRFFEKIIGIKPAQKKADDSDADSAEEGDGEEGYGGGWYDNNHLKGQTSGWQLNQLKDMAKSVYLGRFLTDDKANRRKVTHIPVESINELREPGIYVAVMSQPGRFGEEFQATYFYVSDIGMHVHRQVKQMDVFVTSLTSGKALSDVGFEVLDENAKVIARGSADGEGRATLAGVPDSARILLAKHGREVSMLVLHEPGLDLSEFDVGGHLPRDNKLFVYAGRDLYRPGENFQVSVLARSAEGHVLPAAPVVAELKKPDGDKVSSASWQPNSRIPGYFQHAINLPADAQTGRWSLEVRADPAAKRPDAVWEFQVEEFLPERMKLDLQSDKAVLHPGDAFQIKVQGDYLYGAPAAGNRLLGSVAQERARFALPREWPGFLFGDVADDKEKARHELDETALDAQGQAQIAIPTDFAKVNSPIRVRAALSLLESGGRPVVRSIERTWWPAEAMVGIRPGFDSNVTQEHSAAEFELVRVNPEGKLAPAGEVSFALIKEDRQYYWRYDDQRGWHSGWTESEEPVQTGRLALKNRAKLALPVDWGTYRLEVTDPKTGLVARYRFYAGWNAQEAESVGNRPDRVKMALESVPAKPGSEVKLTLTPPHDGQALIVVEADKVLWSKRVSVSTSGTQVTIPIDKSWNRSDMYISAVVFRPGNEGDKVTPARALGLVHLPLAREDRKLKVALSAPDRVDPERKIPVRVKVDGAAGKQAIVTLSAVDVGILNITQYKTPDAFDFFFGKHRYSAELADIYGKLIEKMDGIRGKLKWGGDAGMRETRSMPKKVKLIDLFSGPVVLDAKGEASIPVTVPDFNGTLRLMAVASTADNFGQGEREMVVSAPIVAEISMPRFIAPGDAATIALDVTNMSGSAQEVSVKLSAADPVKISGPDKVLSLKNKQREILRFTAEATAPYGVARITLNVATAGAKPLTIKREFALQVQPPMPREQDMRRARIEPGTSYKIDPALVERYFRGSATLSATLSNKPPLNVKSLVKGLLDYPYGCLEQTTSAAYPHLYIDEEAAKAYGLAPHSREERAKFVEGAIARIAGMQGAAGGFNLWGSNGPYEYWLTPYVTGFLMDARDAGFNVPAQMHKQAMSWMLDKFNGAGNYFPSVPASLKPDDKGRYKANDYELVRNGHQRFAEMAHIGYMLAREQKAPLAVLRLLHDQYRERARSPLPLVHLALALQMMGDSNRAKVALDDAMKRSYGINLAYDDYGWWGEWLGDYGSVQRDYALSYALLVRHKMNHPQRENLLFTLADRMGKRTWWSTQERLAMFLAARSAGSEATGEWTALFKTGDEATSITSRSTASQAIDPAALAKGVSLENKSSGVLFLEVEASGFPLKAPAPRNDVIDISRAWFTTDGKPWSGGSLKVGDMLIARLTVKARQTIHDGLVVDPVPAGLEVENLNLSQGAEAKEFVVEGVNVGEAMNNDAIRHKEYRDDRFAAAVRLDHGELRLFYLLRVVTPGKFVVPSPYAEDMYRPEIRGVGAAREPITIVDRLSKGQ